MLTARMEYVVQRGKEGVRPPFAHEEAESIFGPMTVEEHRQLGRHFGYPECCIEEFVRDLGELSRKVRGEIFVRYRNSSEPNYDIFDNRMSYVPCSNCSLASRKRQ